MAITNKYTFNWNTNDTVWTNNWLPTNITYVNWKLNWWVQFNWTWNITIANISNTWTFSFSCIIKVDWTWNYTFFTKWSDYPTDGWGFQVSVNNLSINCSVVTTSPSIVWYNSPSKTLIQWQYYYIYWYFNNTTKKVWLYINWVFIWETTTWNTMRNNNACIFWANRVTAGWYVGQVVWVIDEVEIYNSILSQAEIVNKYAYYFWFF